MRLAIHSFLTLDGVMQAPGGPDEDRESGFEFGGWSFPFADEDFGTTMGEWISRADAFLLGRKTYEIFAGYWPKVTDPKDVIASSLNNRPKYVASTTLRSADWYNSSLLGGDVAAQVRKLKEQPGREIQVHGSGVLAHTLIDHDLIDEYRLCFFPVHLGTGKKLFHDGARPGSLRLTSSKVTGSGVIISTYDAAGPVEVGSFGEES